MYRVMKLEKSWGVMKQDQLICLLPTRDEALTVACILELDAQTLADKSELAAV